MTPSRLAPFTHPLAPLFYAAVDSLGAALAPESTRLYRGTARAFLMWLGDRHPDVVSLHQLRRDPHILGWMTALRSRVPPLAPVTYITRLITLRGILSELAYTAQLAELGQLLRRQDIPRRPHTLPRALPADHDHCSSRNCYAATISAPTSSSCSATPACASAKPPISPSIASTPPAPISGGFTYPSAS